jgi:hypothetical protein
MKVNDNVKGATYDQRYCVDTPGIDCRETETELAMTESGQTVQFSLKYKSVGE